MKRLFHGRGFGSDGPVALGAHRRRASARAAAVARPYSPSTSAAFAAAAAAERVTAEGLEAAAAHQDDQAQQAGEPRQRAQEHPVLHLDYLRLLATCTTTAGAGGRRGVTAARVGVANRERYIGACIMYAGPHKVSRTK